MDCDEETTRLYDRSKTIQNKIKEESLRFLTSMQKELYQNYAMFEKPPRSNTPEQAKHERDSSMGSH